MCGRAQADFTAYFGDSGPPRTLRKVERIVQATAP
jgi:hypothetical protein